jgi:hypothetical protein
MKKNMRTSKRGKSIPVRFDDGEEKALRELEQKGLNMSELIRRCVKRSLRDVVEELKSEL